MKGKRVGKLIVLFAVTGILAGCGGKTGGTPDDHATNDGYLTTEAAGNGSGSSQSETGQTSGTAGIAKEDIKVGVLYISDPDEGSGYSYTHDLGIVGMQENLGLSDDQIERKIVDDSDAKATEEAIEVCISDGCNIIFTTSWGYMEVTAEMAEKYPDIYFSHGTGYMSNGKNFNNYFGRIYQVRYLSGIVAGMNTKSNKIGYVAAQDSSNSEVTGGIDAFAIGVASVNPDAKIYVAVTNSWYDPDKEKAASEQLLDMGCDVMAQHCDTSYPQTLAQERGDYGIGYNSDMSKDAPKAVLTSTVWNWGAYYTKAVQDLIDGTWTGENYFGGLEEGLVDISPLSDLCVDGTQEKIDEARAKIESGDWDVFDGVIECNDGTTVGTEGEHMSDADITGNIHWYFKNIVEK